jgi:hypothetical protein
MGAFARFQYLIILTQQVDSFVHAKASATFAEHASMAAVKLLLEGLLLRLRLRSLSLDYCYGVTDRLSNIVF